MADIFETIHGRLQIASVNLHVLNLDLSADDPTEDRSQILDAKLAQLGTIIDDLQDVTNAQHVVDGERANIEQRTSNNKAAEGSSLLTFREREERIQTREKALEAHEKALADKRDSFLEEVKEKLGEVAQSEASLVNSKRKLDDQVAEIGRAREKAQEAYVNFNYNSSQYESQLNRRKNELDDFQKSLNAFQESLVATDKNMKDQMKKLDADRGSLDAQKKESDKRLESLQEQSLFTQASLASDRARLDEREQQLRDYGKQLDTTLSSFRECLESKARQMIEETAENIKASLQLSVSENDQLRDECAYLRAECESLRNDSAFQNDEMKLLHDRIAELQARQRFRDPGAPWQIVSDDIAAFISRYRPKVERGCPVSVQDVVMRMIPHCFSRGGDNVEQFFGEADSSKWYCFEQVLDSCLSEETTIPEDALCEDHGSEECYQIKLDMDGDRRSIVFRVIGGRHLRNM